MIHVLVEIIQYVFILLFIQISSGFARYDGRLFQTNLESQEIYRKQNISLRSQMMQVKVIGRSSYKFQFYHQ